MPPLPLQEKLNKQWNNIFLAVYIVVSLTFYFRKYLYWNAFPYRIGTLMKSHHSSITSIGRSSLAYHNRDPVYNRESESIPLRMWMLALTGGRTVLLIR